ncbi:hypothetical protein LJC46_03760 [Desulfovibrio sp. OttesenSCG-928-G15]|nr:hypothetical protein [Desulfovibrio sp. OttesenSCG-928-G15]
MRIMLPAITFCLAVLLCAPARAADAAEDVPPPWEGQYCNEERCLAVTNLDEGPEGGLFFDFAVTTVRGETLGKASAMVDEHRAGYNALLFDLAENGTAITMSLDPELPLEADQTWFRECPGLYARAGAFTPPLITLEGGGESASLTAKNIRNGKEAALEARIPDLVQFILRRGTPNGTNLIAVYGDTGENLLGTLPPAMRGFDGYGEIEEGFSIQFAVRDLNGDTVPEVLVATSDGAAVLTAAVFVYTPQGIKRFHCSGVIEGQNALHVDAKGVISVPYGSQGLFTEYIVAADGAITERR